MQKFTRNSILQKNPKNLTESYNQFKLQYTFFFQIRNIKRVKPKNKNYPQKFSICPINEMIVS